MVEEIAKKATTRIGFTVVMLAVLLVLGTVGFHSIETYQSGLLEGENWTYVDSFYFSAMTITTIGYGDLYPSHDLSKVITVFYAFFGVALVLYLLGVMARWYIERSAQFEEHEIKKLKRILYKHETRKENKKNT